MRTEDWCLFAIVVVLFAFAAWAFIHGGTKGDEEGEL